MRQQEAGMKMNRCATEKVECARADLTAPSSRMKTKERDTIMNRDENLEIKPRKGDSERCVGLGCGRR